MGQYVAQWNYRSGHAEFSMGAVVHMTDDLAQAVLNDSPGVLVPATAEDLDREARGLPVQVAKPKAAAKAKGGQEPGEGNEPGGDEQDDGGNADNDLDEDDLDPGDNPAEGGQEPGEGDRQVTAASNRQKKRGSTR